MKSHTSYPEVMKVEVIDDQHGFFFECLECLEEAMAEARGAAVVPHLLEALSQFADAHFWTEERLMEAYQFPLRDMHALEHRKGRERLALFALHRDDHAAAIGCLLGLRQWLETHIEVWDAKLGEYLTVRGLD